MQRIATGAVGEEELALESTVRPRRLDEFAGQDRVKENLAILIDAARHREEPVDHVLLYGPPGLGQTTLPNIAAAARGGETERRGWETWWRPRWARRSAPLPAPPSNAPAILRRC